MRAAGLHREHVSRTAAASAWRSLSRSCQTLFSFVRWSRHHTALAPAWCQWGAALTYHSGEEARAISQADFDVLEAGEPVQRLGTVSRRGTQAALRCGLNQIASSATGLAIHDRVSLLDGKAEGASRLLQLRHLASRRERLLISSGMRALARVRLPFPFSMFA